MNISAVIDLINKERGTNLNSAYYEHIERWRRWWKGHDKDFHDYVELWADGRRHDRRMYSMRMGKQVCSDWASILLNEKTTIVLDDNASSIYLQGDDETGGVFKDVDFWHRGNELVEKAFATGTGAAVLRLKGMAVTEGGAIIPSDKSKIGMVFLPAGHIIPLTVREGDVIDVTFASEVLEKGVTYIYLETHEMTNQGYKITNRYFQEEEGSLKEAELPPGIAPALYTGDSVPLFYLIKPNLANNIDENTALGVSVFSEAIDTLKGVDLAYNNFCKDFKLGGKKVFVDETLCKRADDGSIITPDDVAQQLFVNVGDPNVMKETDTLIHEYNPDLRVADNKDGVQAQLDYLSFKVGFGTKHYQFNGTSIVTATQYTGDKQELIQNASKHSIIIEAFLQGIVHAILWAGKTFCGQAVNPDAKVTINFEDGYIIDKDSERLRDQGEVRDGLMMDWEFRVKWYGETEEQAKAVFAKKSTGKGLFEEET